MAETLNIDRILGTSFEIKRSYLYILEVEGIESYLFRSTARPSMNVATITRRYLNRISKWAGQPTYPPIPFTIVDPIAPSGAQKVLEWFRKVYEVETGRGGYKSSYAQDIILKLLGPVMDVVEKWRLRNCWPQNLNFGNVGYDGGSNAVDISGNFEFDHPEHLF